MSKLRIYIISFFAALLIVACEKNQEAASGSVNAINAVVVEGDRYNDRIDEVKLLINCEKNYGTVNGKDVWEGIEVAKGDYRNGSFSIELPDNVSNLIPFEVVLPPKINISKKNISYAYSNLIAYNKDGEQVGFFYYVCYKEEMFEAEAGLWYVNSDFTITGTDTETDEYGTTYIKYNCNFKKGWNFLFWHGNRPDGKGNRIDETTSTVNGSMYWFFRANDDPGC
jgi:hypothetical protein